jgi:hypothetical protein
MYTLSLCNSGVRFPSIIYAKLGIKQSTPSQFFGHHSISSKTSGCGPKPFIRRVNSNGRKTPLGQRANTMTNFLPTSRQFDLGTKQASIAHPYGSVSSNRHWSAMAEPLASFSSCTMLCMTAFLLESSSIPCRPCILVYIRIPPHNLRIFYTTSSRKNTQGHHSSLVCSRATTWPFYPIGRLLNPSGMGGPPISHHGR